MSHYQGILIWTEVVCAVCNKTTAGQFVRHGRRQMRIVMAEIEKVGWINRNGDAICPDCQGKYDLPVPSAAVQLPTPFKGAK